MDTVSKATRSKIMRAVKPFGNKTTEIAMGKLLRLHCLLGYRKHWHVAGKPDFAWPRLKVALFVDGCFWHGCPRCNRMPTSNIAFWNAHIGGNQERDKRVTRTLRRDGWAVVRIWECRVHEARTLLRIEKIICERRETV